MSAMTTAATADFDLLDAELARWLRARTTLRATRDRDASPLDDVAMALRKLRATLSFTAAHGMSNEASVVAVVARTYRWSIRMARELDAIEQLALDPLTEWARFEAFAPFALAFFGSLLAAPLSEAPTTTDVARLRRDVGAVLAPLAIAMASSAMAA